MDYRNKITVLRERLLDFSKRNRALYFRPTKKSINLTLLASRYEKTLAWDENIAALISAEQQLHVNDYIHLDYNELANFKYIVKLANQNIRDFGFSNLHFITCMLKWKDVTVQDAGFQYSPLLLWPASITADQSQTQFDILLSDNDIVVNPYLVFLFKTKYNIHLPQTINAQLSSIDEFIKDFMEQLATTEMGIHVVLKNAQNAATHSLEHSNWIIDAVNIRLAIINTQKASILADYEHIITQPNSDNLNQLLVDQTNISTTDQQYVDYRDVINADFTQRLAINHSNTSQSYTIQGPPGTGKSQVITNLIAQLIAQDKRVLFVCEKRAALDVVYQRLQETELDVWCNYIHDSQQDRKVFMQQLQQAVNKLNSSEVSHQIVAERDALVAQITQIEANFNRYHEVNTTVLDYIGIPTYQFLDRWAERHLVNHQLVGNDWSALPDYSEYLTQAEQYNQAYQSLQVLKANEITIDNFENLNLGILTNPDNDQDIKELQQNLADWLSFSNKYQTINWAEYRVLDLLEHIDQAQILYDLFKHYHWSLLKPYAQLTKAFNQELAQVQRAKQDFSAYTFEYNHWIAKPTYNECIQYYKICNQYQNHLLKIVYPSWHEAKSWFSKHYDISQLSNQVKWDDVIKELIDWYEAENQLKAEERHFLNQYGFENIEDATQKIKEARQHIKAHTFIANLIKYKRPSILVAHFIQQKGVLDTLFLNAKILWRDAHELTLEQIAEKINHVNTHVAVWPSELNISIDTLLPIAPNTLAAMSELVALDIDLSDAVLYKTYQKLLKRHPVFAVYNAATLHQDRALYDSLSDRLRTVNIAAIHDKMVQQYAAIQPDKKNENYPALKTGWSILNKEFQKKRKLKSIRTLMSSESGDIIHQIKPIWLMSPLSVAEIFPLDTTFFDVVIFDEASQIPLEYSIPAIYRAKQTIVVGDTQQMPPSDYFATHYDVEVTDDTVFAADSLLDVAGQRYPNVMLRHHYRSQSELLIRFSNSFFYDNALLTIPDLQQHNQLATTGVYQNAVLQRIMQQHISFHHLENGRFIQRQNDTEAQYIADIVYEMLMNDVKESIGIVAFSIEQQRAIIRVLDRLADQDAHFGMKYEAAKNRFDGNLFQGLIVRNLEQIQGDERDIIIISIGYGYDYQQKMRMHFGPVNRVGGEKRLNVLLSRARKHMVVVSSIKDTDITSEDNKGTLMLKRLLTYVAAIDQGNITQGSEVFNEDKKLAVNHEKATLLSITARVGHYLVSKGYEVAYDYGYSDFKISISIKKPENAYFNTAIVLDDHHFYQTDALSAFYFRTKMLKDAGWCVIPLFTKDLLQDEQQFWDDLDRMLV